ncbi:MAG: HAD family hydrolase [Lachnospiraceae bacterium]|nr:HAD family hydrolase [Lachnospiraceae bacterium]
MGVKTKKAALPKDYETYVFDLYGTLVDIRTDEGDMNVWEKLALFYGYYQAHYTAKEIKSCYEELVKGKETNLKSTLEQDPKYTHEASPEIEITEVFQELFLKKGVEADESLAIHAGQFFRILTTEYVRLYEGTVDMLEDLKTRGKKIYLLSNAQRIFTAYEMHVLDIAKYFDGILISSDFKTKKPDKRFFDILLEKYSMKPETTLFVGNDSRTDIGGAKTVDFATYYVKSNISPQGDMAENADYIVDDFEKWSI